MNAFSLRSGTSQVISALTTFINTVLKGLASNKARLKKKLKGIQIGKEVKLSLFTDNMIVCRKFMESEKRRTDNEVINVIEYKINTQKPSIIFIYPKLKILKYHFKNMKCLGEILQELYT